MPLNAVIVSYRLSKDIGIPKTTLTLLRHRDLNFFIFYLLVFDQLQGVADP
jgi:hypothetical protein